MDLSVVQSGDVVVIGVRAEHLDAGNSSDFRKAMTPLLENTLKAVLDMSELHFVDSSGLGAILSCLRVLKERGGDLKLCRTTKPVSVLFDLVRLHHIISLYSTQEEAVRDF